MGLDDALGDRQAEPGAGDRRWCRARAVRRCARPRAGGMPPPWSRTSISTWSPARAAADEDLHARSDRPWVMAFSSRFTITCSRRSWSAHTGSRSVDRTPGRTSSPPWTQSAAASTTRRRSHQSGLQPQAARLDGGRVEQVADEALHAGRLGGDRAEEPLGRLGVPGQVRLAQGRRVAAGWRSAACAARGSATTAARAGWRVRAPQRGRLPLGGLERLGLHGQGERPAGVVEQLEGVGCRRRSRGGGPRGRPGPRGMRSRHGRRGRRPPAGRGRRRRRSGQQLGGRPPQPGRGLRRRRCRSSSLATWNVRCPRRARPGRRRRRRRARRSGDSSGGGQPALDPVGPGERLEHGPHRLEDPVPARHLGQQPLALDRAARRSRRRGGPAPAARHRGGRPRRRSRSPCRARPRAPTTAAAHSLRMPDRAAASR